LIWFIGYAKIGSLNTVMSLCIYLFVPSTLPNLRMCGPCGVEKWGRWPLLLSPVNFCC